MTVKLCSIASVVIFENFVVTLDKYLQIYRHGPGSLGFRYVVRGSTVCNRRYLSAVLYSKSTELIQIAVQRNRKPPTLPRFSRLNSIYIYIYIYLPLSFSLSLSHSQYIFISFSHTQNNDPFSNTLNVNLVMNCRRKSITLVVCVLYTTLHQKINKINSKFKCIKLLFFLFSFWIFSFIQA